MPEHQLPKAASEALASQRRREILSAMERLIVRGGIENVTTRKIAEEMGATIGVIWHYFRDKSELFEQLVADNFDRWFSAVEDQHDHSDAWGCFSGLFVNTMPDYSVDHSMVWFALLQKTLVEPVLRANFIEKYSALRALAETRFIRCQAEGLIRPELDAGLECQRLFALADGLAISSLIEPDRVDVHVIAKLIETQLSALKTVTTR